LYIMGDRRVFMKKKWYLPTKGAAIGIVFVFVLFVILLSFDSDCVTASRTYYCENFGTYCD